MTRRRSFTDQLYRTARASATGRAAVRGPVPLANRYARKAVYRHTSRLTRSLLRGFGL